MKKKNRNLITLVALLQIFCLLDVYSQITSPLAHFGFEIGKDYHLTNYTETETYFLQLAKESDRIVTQNLGLTEEGRNQYMLIVSSAENLKKMEHYQEISRNLALADLADVAAQRLAEEGKAVVWIDGGLHSTETVGTHQLIETIYQMVSRDDDEVKRILNEVIILFVHANPDGHEIVGDWYMQEPVATKRKMGKLPVMYHKYIGHDNNRDFFMFNMAESRNMAKPLFIDWIPQIVYNHHQSAPAGTVVVGPPYRDPFNYVYDPILVTSLDAVGAAMHTRLNVEDKPGYGQRGASRYSTWWNGGLRTSVYFHNMIGILTEIVGGPNPSSIPLYLNRILPNGDSPNPIHPQQWNFRKSIDYSVTLNMAVLNYAARNKRDLLYNIYKMGSNSIRKGKEPNLLMRPGQISFMREVSKNKADNKIAEKWFAELNNDPERKDPVAYIIPADQTDMGTAVKFLNKLILAGVTVEKVNEDFACEEKTVSAGSYVVRLAQAFRPHILDMFEPQDHPNDFEYKGGPPIPPYDAAGWTLAYVMGVKFDRVKSPISSSKTTILVRGQQIENEGMTIPKGKYMVFTTKANDNYKLINKLLKKGIIVQRDKKGNFYVENTVRNREVIQSEKSIAYHVNIVSKLPIDCRRLDSLRIALWDNYGGTMKSGWMRWLLEDFGFDFEVIYNPDIDRGNLKDQYDVIIFPGGGIARSLKKSGVDVPEPDQRAGDLNKRLGNFTADISLPSVTEFVHQGGKIIMIGESSNLAKHLGIHSENPLIKNVDGKKKPLSKEEFYIPGSIMNLKVNTIAAETSGLEDRVDIYFDNSPIFRFNDDGVDNKITPLLLFDSEHSLKSGWALGQHYLNNTVAAYSAPMGRGRLFVFGPEIVFRAQAHSTFRLVFNQLY